MKLIYLKSALKCDSFDVAIDIKIQFFRVLVTIKPDRSLLQFVTTNCLIILVVQWHVHRDAVSQKYRGGGQEFLFKFFSYYRREKIFFKILEGILSYFDFF